MISLNLPPAELKIKSKENKQFIFDIIRKKYVVLTPEEWVRQHLVHFLISEKKYPKSLMAVEKQVVVNTLKKRFDILIFNKEGSPDIIIECKAPTVPIGQESFDQIARYNLELKAKHLLISNGLKHYFCRMNSEKGQYDFLNEIPNYSKD